MGDSNGTAGRGTHAAQVCVQLHNSCCDVGGHLHVHHEFGSVQTSLQAQGPAGLGEHVDGVVRHSYVTG